MATNADTVVDDDKPVTEDDIRALKYDEDGVETSKEADEPEASAKEDESTKDTAAADAGQTTPAEGSEEESEEPSFVKKFPHIKGDTPEEYAKNVEVAYENSTAEFQRLRSEATKDTEVPKAPTDTEPVNPNLLYAKQMVDRDIQKTFEAFKKQYPQVDDPIEYDKFVSKTTQLSSFIMASENRAATADELYPQVATILGWQPETVTSDDKLKMSLKDNASTSKSSSSTKKTSASKVTDDMISAHRKLYPMDSRSDSAVREELEPYIT